MSQNTIFVLANSMPCHVYCLRLLNGFLSDAVLKTVSISGCTLGKNISFPRKSVKALLCSCYLLAVPYRFADMTVTMDLIIRDLFVSLAIDLVWQVSNFL